MGDHASLGLFSVKTPEDVFIWSTIAQAAIDRPVHVEEFAFDALEAFTSWLDLTMEIQESLALRYVILSYSEFCKTFSPGLMAMEVVDLEVSKNRSEYSFGLLFCSLLRQVADKDLHGLRLVGQGQWKIGLTGKLLSRVEEIRNNPKFPAERCSIEVLT